VIKIKTKEDKMKSQRKIKVCLVNYNVEKRAKTRKQVVFCTSYQLFCSRSSL
jgi:hypothetical protein